VGSGLGLSRGQWKDLAALRTAPCPEDRAGGDGVPSREFEMRVEIQERDIPGSTRIEAARYNPRTS
jgi:hypothetical protein